MEEQKEQICISQDIVMKREPDLVVDKQSKVES